MCGTYGCYALHGGCQLWDAPGMVGTVPVGAGWWVLGAGCPRGGTCGCWAAPNWETKPYGAAVPWQELRSAPQAAKGSVYS